MKKIILFTICIAFFCHITTAQKKPVHVIITAGQSNTDGRVPNDRLPDYIKAMADTSDFSKGRYNYCQISHNRGDGRFFPFWPKSKRRAKPNAWAYDAVTYYWLEQLFQEKFYVIKWAIGGTSIAPLEVSPNGRYWSADPEWLSQNTSTLKKGKSLLLSLVESIDASIDKTLSKFEEGYQIDAFLWHQGESDQTRGEEYYDNLRNVIQYVRKHLTEKTGEDYSNLPFIFGTVPRKNRQYSPDVEAGMRRLAEEDPNACLIDMSEGELQGDRTHFNEKSAEYLGKQMYERLKKITGN